MDINKADQLASSWIKLTKIAHEKGYNCPEADELFWASMKLDELVNKDPDEAWKIILEILKKDSDQIILMNLSAGPLEDLLVRHGEEVIERIETEAKHDKAFKLLLGGVWQNKMKDDIWLRIQKIK